MIRDGGLVGVVMRASAARCRGSFPGAPVVKFAQISRMFIVPDLDDARMLTVSFQKKEKMQRQFCV